MTDSRWMTYLGVWACRRRADHRLCGKGRPGGEGGGVPTGAGVGGGQWPGEWNDLYGGRRGVEPQGHGTLLPPFRAGDAM
jgi:hypothetical protein